MKTVAALRFPKENRVLWTDMSNSIPAGASISTMLKGGAVAHLVAAHVHIALSEDIRVICLVGAYEPQQFLHSGQFCENDWYDYKVLDEDENIRKAYYPIHQAIEHAMHGWDVISSRKAA